MSIRAALAWTWTALILALCWLPRTVIGTETPGPKSYLIPHLDKLVHFGLFAGFAWLWAGARPDRLRTVLLAGVALGIVTELGQMVPILNRDAGLDDALADVVGVLAGLGVHFAIRRRDRSRGRAVS